MVKFPVANLPLHLVSPNVYYTFKIYPDYEEIFIPHFFICCNVIPI